jgi:hypothetical protein
MNKQGIAKGLAATNVVFAVVLLVQMVATVTGLTYSPGQLRPSLWLDLLQFVSFWAYLVFTPIFAVSSILLVKRGQPPRRISWGTLVLWLGIVIFVSMGHPMKRPLPEKYRAALKAHS